jgi:hypothetical protein
MCGCNVRWGLEARLEACQRSRVMHFCVRRFHKKRGSRVTRVWTATRPFDVRRLICLQGANGLHGGWINTSRVFRRT